MIKHNNFMVAKTPFARLRGLFFRRKPDVVVLIMPCKDIHTLFLKRKIDVAFVTPNGTVIESIMGLKPWKRVRNKEAFAVIERFSHPKKGWFNKGDRISFDDFEFEEVNDENMSSMQI